MSTRAILYRQEGSSLADIWTPTEIKGLISNGFSGVRWTKQASGDLTGEIGCCKSGNGTLQFGIFTRAGKTLEGLVLEVSGRLNASALGAVCEFCSRNGLKLHMDNSFEEDVVDAVVEDLSAGTLRAFKVMERQSLAMVR
jgi:hypothetical protein